MKGNQSSDPFSTASFKATWSMSAGSAAGKGYGSVLDAKEWYQNCSGLVDYYTGNGRYRDAEHCLQACDAIIAKHMQVPGPPATPVDMSNAKDRLDEALADMERRWGVLYLNVMQDASRYRQSALHMVADGKMTAEEAHIGKVDPEREAIEPPLSIDFRPLGIEARGDGKKTARALPPYVVDFESARGVFKLAMAVRTRFDGRTDGRMDGWMHRFSLEFFGVFLLISIRCFYSYDFTLMNQSINQSTE
jgi:hypothetical protein